MSGAGPSADKEKEGKKSKHEKIVDYNSSDEDVSEEKSKFIEIERTKDYYCTVCRKRMNSELTWQAHIKGKLHIKKTQAQSLDVPKHVELAEYCQQYKIPGSSQLIPARDTNEIAQVQQFFDKREEEPIVGLDFIKEIWLSEDTAEPAYHCGLCEAECQRISIYDHVIGFRHRQKYLKLIDPERHQEISNYMSKKSNMSYELGKEAVKMEKKYGRGHVKVAVQIDDPSYIQDDMSIRDMDVDSPAHSDDNREREEKREKIKKEKRKHKACKTEPKSKKEKKVVDLPVETRVKGISATTIRSKFENLSDAERLEILKDAEIHPYTRIEDKIKDITKLGDMKNICLEYIKKSAEVEQYARDALNGDFRWSNELMRKMCGRAFLKSS